MNDSESAYLPDKIVSGGQTGVDRAGLDAAIQHGIPVGGWCPAGRRAEDGSIPDCYPLQETKARNFAVRTRRNVKDSDGTLVLNLGELEGGTLQTVDYAQKIGKPCMVLQLDSAEHADVDTVINWLKMHSIKTLNIAGPRESKRPGAYQVSFEFLELVLNASE